MTQRPDFGEADHALDLHGRAFLVREGNYERAIAGAAIARFGGKPGVPCARDALRRPPPVHHLLGLPQRRFVVPASLLSATRGLSPPGSCLLERKNTSLLRVVAMPIPRNQSALEIRWPYAIRP